MATKRNYAGATAYEERPAQVKKREERNQARAIVEKRVGHKLPTDVDVDHKKPIALGGKNTEGNLRAISESRNSAWRKGQRGYKVKPV